MGSVLSELMDEAKRSENADKCGMFLIHNGVVRATPRSLVRPDSLQNAEPDKECVGIDFDYDDEKVKAGIDAALSKEGIYYAKIRLNRGRLKVGDDIMYVIVGGDIREHVSEALMSLVAYLKSECVTEREVFK